MILEEENPTIRQTIFIINPKLSYQFDVNQTIHIYSLKKMITAAANLQKNNFSLIHNDIDYTDQDDARLMTLFPNKQVVTFYIQKGPIEELDESIMKIHLRQYCPLHEFKYLSYYCFNCNKSICSICITEKIHQYHNYKEKCDYLQSSKNLVDYAFKNNSTINMDPQNVKQSEKIALVSDKINKVYFGKLHEMLNGIQAKFNEVIEYYNKTNKNSVNNMQDNLILFKKFCVKGLDEVKEEIGIQKIMIDEEVFLTFHNKYTDLINQQIRLEQDLNKVNELNNALPPKIEELAEAYYSQIYKLLYELLMNNTYQSLLSSIKEKDIASLQEKEVVSRIIGNLKTFFEKSILNKEALDTSNSNISKKSLENSNRSKQKQTTDKGLFINPYSVSNISQPQVTSNQIEDKLNKSSLSENDSSYIATNPFIPIQQFKKVSNSKDQDKDFIIAPIIGSLTVKVLFKNSNSEIIPLKYNPLLSFKTFLPSCTYTNYKLMLYISGGLDFNLPSKLFFKYDYSQKNFLRLPDMLVPRANHSIIAYDDTIYAIGGNNTNTCEKFILNSSSWIKMENMISKERCNAMLHINGNFLYAFFGKEGNGFNETVERIHLRSIRPVWEKVKYQNKQHINLKYFGCAIHELNNELFFFGGKHEEQATNTVISYDFSVSSFNMNEQELDWKEYFVDNKLERLGEFYCQIAAESYMTIFLDLINNS